MKYTNQLATETSPYLLQHAHNPVNWFPWGDEALEKARKENKLLLISIGYAACHWCHVMEHESFEDLDVAEVMNDNFICIKVDREERPDIDQVYMDAAHLLHGTGGWPLNAFALPDGRPFYAATYFPKNRWISLLENFIDLQRNNLGAIEHQAELITQGINELDHFDLEVSSTEFDQRLPEKIWTSWKDKIDLDKGGNFHAPKFPMPTNWEYLLHYSQLYKSESALDACTRTLDKMAMGGIYDHIGGGFARYSTDIDWHIPHFEKMLYDNAQLVSLYAHAWRLTKNDNYKKVVYETLEFVERELLSPEGGFYSSLDADTEGEEGKYYVWKYEELTELLHENAEIIAEYYQFTKSGNWEDGNNVPICNQSLEEFAANKKLSLSDFQETLNKSKTTLFEYRQLRTRPGLDDKILSSWNALMLKGYIDAYRAFGEEKFLEIALRNANFLLSEMLQSDGSMWRNHKNNTSNIHGFLDDYAFTISALTSLFQATFDPKYLNLANKIGAYAIENFIDPENKLFYYTHKNHSNLIARKKELSDNVIASSNSEMAKNLFILGHLLQKNEYISLAKEMTQNIVPQLSKNIQFYSNWGINLLNFTSNFYEIAIVGKEAFKIREEFDKEYIPNCIILGSQEASNLELLQHKYVERETLIYLCHNNICQSPKNKIADILSEIMN